jgi:hypothetical protein
MVHRRRRRRGEERRGGRRGRRSGRRGGVEVTGAGPASSRRTAAPRRRIGIRIESRERE